MKSFTLFINKVFKQVADICMDNENPYSLFAEITPQLYSNCREYAALRNEYARTFVEIINDNYELFNINKEVYKLKNSPLYPLEVKIEHSCYPKNIRRWLTGTVARKKSCRIEFCILVWCWCNGWFLDNLDDSRLLFLRKEIAKICNVFVGQCDRQEHLSLELLWKACEQSYKDSF